MNAFGEYKDKKLTDQGFSFTIDVSLDSNNGVSRRYHVGNNPVNFVDPLGLEWVNPVSYWRNLYRYARENRTWGHQQYPGEENSSMRHCVVSCMVASNFGTAGARAAGVGNEVQGLVLHDIPDIRGRISGERPWAFQWQDLKDNERGFQAAKKNCSNMSESDTRQSCIQRCQGQ